MYRLLEVNKEIRERRNQLTHPAYQKPELLATAPNQVWSWDITKLLGPAKWSYFYLYVILDIFSRYVVGWMIAPGNRRHWRKAHQRNLCKAEDRKRPTHDACGSGLLHEIQAGGIAPVRPGGDQDPQPAVHQR